MSRKSAAWLAVAVSLAVGGWALAQPAAPAPAAPGGPFAVCPSGAGAVLLDTKTGHTWVLTPLADREPVWLPVKRIDDAKTAEHWRERERMLGQMKQKEQEREAEFKKRVEQAERERAAEEKAKRK